MKYLFSLLIAAALAVPGIAYAKGGSSFSGGRSSGFSGGRSLFSGGKSSFSGGSRPSFSGGSKPSFSGGSRPSMPKSGGGFSGGSKSTPSKSGGWFSGGSKSSPAKPAHKPSFDKGYNTAASKASSRAAYSPKISKSFSSPKANPAPHVKAVTKHVTPERYTTRGIRAASVYGPQYVTHHTTVAYHDPFNSFLTTWLLTQSLSDRSAWAYNHRNEMDDARYKDLLARDKELEAKVKELEAKGDKRDPNYVPPGMKDHPDLMYSDDFVKNVKAESESRPSNVLRVLAVAFLVIGGFALLILCVWFIFLRKA